MLINQAYHCIDLLVWLLGPLRIVGAAMDTLAMADAMETEDTLVAAMQASSGALVALTASGAAANFWRTRFELCGTLGRLSFDIDHPDTLHEVEGPPDLMAAVSAYRALPDDEPPTAGLNYYGVSHRRQIAEFVTAARGVGGVAVDGARARETLETIRDIYRAAGAPMWR